MANADAKENLTKDLGTVVLSIIVAIILARGGILKDFLFASQEREIFATFLAGMFFTSLFTVAPATVVLAELAEAIPIWQITVVGGLGAVCGDLLIFRFVKNRLSPHLKELLQNTKIRKLIPVHRLVTLRWLMFVLGAVVVASPLPDELGLAMMGLIRIKMFYFILLSFVLNSFGIFVVGLIGTRF